MSSKTVPLSVRLPQEDAEFISRQNVPGAKTPSDKLRAIIADARRREAGAGDYRSCLQLAQDLLAPASAKLREAENGAKKHSELVTRLGGWLPDMLAYMMSAMPERNEKETEAGLRALEEGVADRVFVLMESILQLAVTPRCPCYDSRAVGSRIQPVLALTQAIATLRATGEEMSR